MMRGRAPAGGDARDVVAFGESLLNFSMLGMGLDQLSQEPAALAARRLRLGGALPLL
jgi:hypothetical protein